MKFGRQDYNGRIVDLQNKIPEDEPVFLLRSSDSLAPKLLLMWAMELRLKGGDPMMASEAESHAQKMIDWQRTHPAKTPDMYHSGTTRNLIYEKITELLDNFKQSDINQMTELLGKYYGCDGSSLIYILLPTDKDPAFGDLPIQLLREDHFKLSDLDEKIKMSSAKLVVYFEAGGKSKIIRNGIER